MGIDPGECIIYADLLKWIISDKVYVVQQWLYAH